MNRIDEIINRKPSRWGNLTIKEFERDIKLLQETCRHLVIRDEYVKQLEEKVVLLEKLYEVANKLDQAYLDSIRESGKSSFTGEEYDELNDVLIEMEESLGI